MQSSWRKLAVLALAAFLALPALAATAGDDLDAAVEVLGAEDAGTHQGFIFAIRPAYWMPALSGDASLDDDAGNRTTLDADKDLGIADTEGSFSGEANLRIGDFDVWASGFSLSRSGDTTVTRTIIFGNINVTGTTALSTDLKFTSIGARIGWALFGSDDSGFRFGPTIGVNLMRVDLEVVADNVLGVTSERVDESAPVPAIGARLEVPVGDFLLTGDIQGLMVNFDEFDGTFLDLSATLTWRPAENMAAFFGYRYMSVDVTGTVSGQDYSVDMKLSGPFAGFELRF